MKKNLFLAFIHLLVTASVQGQLPGKANDLLKDKAKSKKETSAPSESPEPQQEKQSPADKLSNGGSPMSRDNGPKNSNVELDFDAEPIKAAISWESLLAKESVYFNATNGDFKLNNLDIAFLPKKTKSGQAVSYESFDNPTPIMRMDVIDAASKELKGTLYYSASATTAPFHNMEMMQRQGWPYSVKLTEGSYELHFWAGTTHFYTFPLRVEKFTNSDPYAPVSTFYHLRGPWEEWAFVKFGPDGHFIFNFYHTYQTTEVENAARWDARRPFKTMVKINREGKMVAVYRLKSSSTEFEWNDIQADNCVWKKFDMTFHSYPPPTGPNNRPFFLKENMKDGNYTVEVLLKEEKSGKDSTYKYAFTVKEGKIVQADKADRSKNPDALQFLEQGRDKFFVKRIQ